MSNCYLIDDRRRFNKQKCVVFRNQKHILYFVFLSKLYDVVEIFFFSTYTIDFQKRSSVCCKTYKTSVLNKKIKKMLKIAVIPLIVLLFEGTLASHDGDWQLGNSTWMPDDAWMTSLDAERLAVYIGR